MIENIKILIEQFFAKFKIDISDLEIKIEEEKQIIIQVQSKDSGLLIGPNGKNIESIENIIKLMAFHHLDKKVKLTLKVNDYSKTKEERLFQFIYSKVQQAQQSKRNIELPFFTPYERKKIQEYVQALAIKGISTQSMWEWNKRRLHIITNLNSKKLTIDIDGDDI